VTDRARPGSETSALAPAELAARTARLERLARLMDRAVSVPGTRIGFGMDPIIGLIPGVGDAVASAVAVWIVLEAARLGVPQATLLRMLSNVAVDTFGGTVPIAGDLWDVAWRANMKNVALVRAHVESPVAARRASKLVVAGVVTGVVLLGAAAIAVSVWLGSWLVRALRGR